MVKYPFGEVTTFTASATGTQAITITDSVTIIDGVTNVATGNRTLDLTLSDELAEGAIIHLRAKTTATETTIFGTGITAPTVTGAAAKTFTQSFWFNGTAFVPTGAKIQID